LSSPRWAPSFCFLFFEKFSQKYPRKLALHLTAKSNQATESRRTFASSSEEPADYRRQDTPADALAVAISSEDFRDGLEVELEHGLTFSDANVTNNHPILTGKIFLAHLKETLDYYVRLRVAEIEGDMLKALIGNNSEKLMQKYRLWMSAKADLASRERELSRKT
jgi:Protein of unknown function (DUF5661)